MRHSVHDKVSQEIARRIATGLLDHPEWIALAKANLDRWIARNQDAPALLRCYSQWQALLELPVTSMIAALTASTEEGQRLRQNSPFAGALPPAVVWGIKRSLRHEQNAA
jgi:hypothetical protein